MGWASAAGMLRSAQCHKAMRRHPAAERAATCLCVGGCQQRGTLWSARFRMRACRAAGAAAVGQAGSQQTGQLATPACCHAQRQHLPGAAMGTFHPGAHVHAHRMRKPPKMRPCMLRCCGWQVKVFSSEVSSIKST
jgi:hypothetical protein